MGKAPPRRPPGAVRRDGGLGFFQKLLVFGGGPVLGWCLLHWAGLFSRSPAVRSLDRAGFQDFLNAHPDGALVEFYTQSCPFCQKLAPEFEAAARELRAKGRAPLASLDANAEPEVAKRLDLQYYPRALWFWKGDHVEELPRASEKTAAEIVEFVEWASAPVLQEIPTKAELVEALPTLRATLPESRFFVVGFTGTAAGLHEALEVAAQRHRRQAAFLSIPEAGATDGATTLKAYGQAESEDIAYEGSVTVEGVREWVKDIMDKATRASLETKKQEMTAKKEELQKTLEEREAENRNTQEKLQATLHKTKEVLEQKLEEQKLAEAGSAAEPAAS
eukprot:gnl/TRDRNA2_/TRDRNA2_40166_c0_seq1.p1 gnl/TRDRNA2_/TRDRNA2_40166_c0~~gnl/TRDRNA2_/TRDRNA2_40166_c0_seq1.p1  ORF type:complete len:334 (-),score=90.14 gnl/TRDRNA2_/TRDRNA2_40166_c0_seq1:41-1042(-)